MLSALLIAPLALGTTPRWAFVHAMDNVADGDWQLGANDDWGPTLSGSEAPYLGGLNAMFRATGDPDFLVEAVRHADAIMEARNDARGVTDFTNEATPCWRDMYYTGGTPYCWVIHTGAILGPVVETAVLIEQSRFGDLLAEDGAPLSEHAAAYTTGAIETFDFHEEQWHSTGGYRIRSDATFLGTEAGTLNPLNGSSVMATAALHVYDLTGDEHYLQRALDIGARWFDNLVETPLGGATWSYYTDDMINLGEDIGHAEPSVRMAGALWKRGELVHDRQIELLVTSLTTAVYVNDETLLSNLMGGTENYLDYQYSSRGWLGLSSFDPAVYAVVRNLYAATAPAEHTTAGGIAGAWGRLAEEQIPLCLGTTATATTVTVTTAEPCLVELDLTADADVTATTGDQQVAVFVATEGRARWLPATADTTFTLASEGAFSFVLRDAVAPTIVSSPDREATVGSTWTYEAEGSGAEPFWWTLSEGPIEARVDPATGVLTWTPEASGETELVLRLDTDAGSIEQSITVCVDVDCPDPVDTDPGSDTDPPDTAAPDTGQPAGYDSDATVPADTGGPTETGCGCGHVGGAGWSLILLAAVATRRRWAVTAAVLLGLEAVPVEATAGSPVAVTITAGHGHTCALLDDGSVTCWGSEAHGQTTVPAGTFEQLDAGWFHTCGMLDDGSATCWGDGGDEQTALTSLPFTAVFGSYHHGVGLTTDGGLSVWGAHGEAVSSQAPSGSGFTSVACGKNHCCALDADDDATCWGQNGLNSDREGPWSDWTAAAVTSCALDDGGALSCFGTGDYAPEPPEGLVLDDVACGTRHCCGLEEGAITCWGDDTVADQLAAPEGSFVALAAGTWHTCALDAEGDVACWGNDAAGQSSVPAELQ